MCEIVETFAFIAAWRGVLIYFARKIKSFSYDKSRYLLILFGISHGAFLAISLLQKYTYRRVVKQNFMTRLMIATTINLAIFIVAVLAWIFYWGAIPYFIHVDFNKVALLLAYHFVSFIIAVVSRTSSLLVGLKNDLKDGNVSASKRIHYPIEYLSFFLEVIVICIILG
jgi:fatty acid desaturase